MIEAVRVPETLDNRLIFWIETDYVPFDDKSDLVREVLLEKTAEWAAEHGVDPDRVGEVR